MPWVHVNLNPNGEVVPCCIATNNYVVGDLNRRRGIIQGMEETVVGNIIKAEVPLSEMFGYATDLRSMTQGRATYTMEFEKYAEIPSNIAEELIQKAS